MDTKGIHGQVSIDVLYFDQHLMDILIYDWRTLSQHSINVLINTQLKVCQQTVKLRLTHMYQLKLNCMSVKISKLSLKCQCLLSVDQGVQGHQSTLDRGCL